MLKPLQIACLTGAGFLVLAASVGGQHPAAAPGSFLLALQEPQATSREAAPRPSLSKVGWIGLMLEDGKGQEVRVKGVFPGGPAAFAGVRAGDVLVRIGGNAADSVAAATAAIEGLVPQRQTTLTIRRQGKPLELKVTVESLGEFRDHYVQEMLRRDPRDRQYGQHHGISDADMSVELVRRLFEQHERMERTLQQVLDEVHALRKEVRALQK
jgi:predicted metalloprotease with PDZ domain